MAIYDKAEILTELNTFLLANTDRVKNILSIVSHAWDPAEMDWAEYLEVYLQQPRKTMGPTSTLLHDWQCVHDGRALHDR